MATDAGRMSPRWSPAVSPAASGASGLTGSSGSPGMSGSSGISGSGGALPSASGPPGAAGASGTPGSVRSPAGAGSARTAAGPAGASGAGASPAGASLAADELRVAALSADVGTRRRDDVGARRGASAHRLMGAVVRRLLDDADEERVEEGSASMEEGSVSSLMIGGADRSDGAEARRQAITGRARRAGATSTRSVNRRGSGGQDGGGDGDGAADGADAPPMGTDAPMATCAPMGTGASMGSGAPKGSGAPRGKGASGSGGVAHGSSSGIRSGPSMGTDDPLGSAPRDASTRGGPGSRHDTFSQRHSPDSDRGPWATPAGTASEVAALAPVAAPQTRITPIGPRDRLAPDRAVAPERVGRSSGMAKVSWGAWLAAVVALVVVVLMGGFDTPGTEGASHASDPQGRTADTTQSR